MRRALILLLLLPGAARAETHRLKPTVGHPTFAVRPPILTVKPGDVLESESLWGEWYEKAGGAWPGEVGPIAIEGAEPGDTLVVEVLKVRPNRDTAVSTQGGRFGALVPDRGTAMLNETFPKGKYIDVLGLCKVVTLKEIEVQGWSLNPGRYVGVADRPADDFDFAQRLQELNEELEQLNAQARELEERIAENVTAILGG